MAFSLRYSAVSDIGRTRKKNDDSGYAGPHFAMVADGMGGAAAGDLASAVTVQTMQRLDAPAPENMLEALAGAVHRANDRLAELIEEDAAVEGMGTTVTAVLFDGERIGVAHLGDSRGYLWRDGELLRITNDHTWVQSLIDEGRISEDEAKVHSHRSLLLKVLDGRHDNDPDLTVYDVQPGDRILICSDGLSGFVDHARMQRVLSIGSADAVAQELVQLALEAGSSDNITVIVADVVDEPAAETAEPVVVGSAADHPRGTISRLRSWAGRPEVTPGEVLVDDDIDPEELRYAPREPKRFRWLVRGVMLVVALGLVALAAVLSYNWSQNQYYVAAYDGGVAIYQGVQADLPGLTLHHVYETEDLNLSELPSFRRSQVLDGLQAEDLDHAQSIVDKLMTFAAACASPASSQSTTGPSGTAAERSGTGPTPTATPAATQRNSPSARRTGQGGTPSTTGGRSRRTAVSGTTGAPATRSTTAG
ncbi:MAG: serine/threonine-protein phosphatase, partial [Propionibacteriales bacterium]|nr:serine/threonine-protein phosphatase [Propionibacteriales bacterium]